jgi:predicted dehydrogenase
MKFLIAGFGSIGRRHFHNLLALGERDIIFYRTGLSTLPDQEIADFIVEKDLDAALAHKPDAVIISNPTALHLDVAIPAAQAGCHLLFEKPISHSMTGIDQLQTSITKGGGKALVGFQFRFHPGLQRIRNLLLEGAIGHPTSVRAHWGEYLPAWHPWEDYRKGYSARSDLGGGVILTLCHPLDYLRWMLGDIVDCWAYAGHHSDLDIDVEDTAEIGIHFSNGVTGTVHLDYIQRPAMHHLEIIGTQGTIRWDNASGAVALYRASQPRETDDADPWQRYNLPAGFERNDMFLAMMEHFIAVIRGSEEPLCTLEDGIQALRIALAAQESAKQGTLITLQGAV